MAQTKELRFLDFLNASREPKQETTSDDQAPVVSEDASQVQPESTVDESPVEGTDAQSGETPEGGESQGQETPAKVSVRFEDLLRQKGIPVDDDSDPAELYESVISRAFAGAQAMSEVSRLRAELEALQSQSQQPAAAPQQQETPVTSEPETAAQQVARRFRELQKYDSLLENYVERDDNGFVKPITSFGQVSIDAARTINEYERASREQADLLLRNPLAVVEDSKDLITRIAEERAKSIVDARFAEMQAKSEQEYQTLSQQEKAQQEQAALSKWHEDHKASLFHLDEKGQPRPDFFGSGEVAWTKTGQAFRQKLNQLRAQLPEAPELTLRQLALEFSTIGAAPEPTPTPAPAPAAPAAPEPVVTQAQQRRLLADNRQPVPNQNTPTASVGQIARTLPTLRLKDMILANPENAERVSGWRN